MTKEKSDDNKKKKSSLIVSAITALIVTALFHFYLGTGTNNIREIISGGNSSFGYAAILAVLFLISFTIIFLFSKGIFKIKKLDGEEDKKKKSGRTAEIIFLGIDVLMTGTFATINWEQISSGGTMWAIAEIAAFFAIVWVAFEFFHHFKFFYQRIFTFIIGFMIKVCIPMLILLIIMLGAYQAKYNYPDTFNLQISDSAEIFGNAMKVAYNDTVLLLYNIGQGNPDLWVWLPIAAFFLMVLWLLFDTFTRKDKSDKDKTAQELIHEVMKEKDEEIAYTIGEKKKPMAYNLYQKINNFLKSKKEKEAELKEKEDEANAKHEVYDVVLIRDHDHDKIRNPINREDKKEGMDK